MTLPKRVQVGPYELDVRCSENEINRASSAAEMFCDGASHSRKGWIALRPDMSTSAKREVLLHEVLHVVWAVAGRHSGKIDEETAIAIFAPTLLDTLRRNPELTAFLLDT